MTDGDYGLDDFWLLLTDAVPYFTLFSTDGDEYWEVFSLFLIDSGE